MNFAVGNPAAASAASGDGMNFAQHRKLTEAAQQFEGMLLQEMLKPMREHGFCQDEREDKDDDGGDFNDTLSSFGTESVATAISKSGGLGIAKMVVQQVEKQRAMSATVSPDASDVSAER